MRSDYLLYSIALIFFVLTGAVLIYTVEMRELWIVATAFLGLLFTGLGYYQRQRPAATTTTEAPPPPPPAPAPIIEVSKEATVEIAEPVPSLPKPIGTDITLVKGIKAKRADQLKALGINSAEDLAKASAKQLGSKLDLSPKITARWIESAKELTEKP